MKQIIIVRKDLGMSKGKMAAQTAHASMGAYKAALKKNKGKVKRWERGGSKKVVVYVSGLEELFALKEQLRGFPKFVVVDAGRTHLSPGTITCMGIGPWDDEELDRYLGNLKLVN